MSRSGTPLGAEGTSGRGSVSAEQAGDHHIQEMLSKVIGLVGRGPRYPARAEASVQIKSGEVFRISDKAQKISLRL